MKVQSSIIIPIANKAEGIHQFAFHLDPTFFDAFEESKIKEGKWDVNVILEKRVGHMSLLLEGKGSILVSCDRCLEELRMPLDFANERLVKYAEEDKQDEVDILYVSKDQQELDLSALIYEFIHLCIPLVSMHEMAGLECDPKMLELLDQAAPEEEVSEEENAKNPIWDVLKDIDLGNK